MNKTEKLTVLAEKVSELTQKIIEHQRHSRLLLDFATDLRKLSIEKCYQHTPENDLRLLSTLKNLHIHMRGLQKEAAKLKKKLFKANKHAEQK